MPGLLLGYVGFCGAGRVLAVNGKAAGKEYIRDWLLVFVSFFLLPAINR